MFTWKKIFNIQKPKLGLLASVLCSTLGQISAVVVTTALSETKAHGYGIDDDIRDQSDREITKETGQPVVLAPNFVKKIKIDGHGQAGLASEKGSIGPMLGLGKRASALTDYPDNLNAEDSFPISLGVVSAYSLQRELTLKKHTAFVQLNGFPANKIQIRSANIDKKFDDVKFSLWLGGEKVTLPFESKEQAESFQAAMLKIGSDPSQVLDFNTKTRRFKAETLFIPTAVAPIPGDGVAAEPLKAAATESKIEAPKH